MSYAVLRSLYERARELTPEARRALFEAEDSDPALRVEIEALIAAERQVTDPIADAIAGAAQQAAELGLPERIGPWRVLGTLGVGGMGVVLLGERADGEFDRRVAIKLIGGFASNAMRERFRRERQVLAALEHPDIAGLVDGGTTAAGEPYLVMPYIEGETLRVWLMRAQPALRTRLALFVRLCRAVHHAHQHLIVHRDLKPGNVMVRADGGPVLLDFGIAKLLDASGEDVQAAHTATRVMTPMYASPEQLLGQPVTTATDVHGLGLLLYELLTGSVPERGDAAHAASTELPPPSQRAASASVPALRADAARIRGDLDRIVRRAVRTEPTARYPSAQALADDVEAWMQGRPVQAAGRHRLYVLGRFLRRNRWAVAAAIVAVAVLANVSLQWKQERDRALVAEASASREAEAASGVTDFLVALFAELDPNVHPGRQLSARELLDVGRARLDEAGASRPDLRARLQQSLGWIYANAGQPLPAIELLEAAAQGHRDAGDTSALVHTETALARAYNSAKRSEEALATSQRAIAGAERLVPPDGKALAHALMGRGVAQEELSRTDEAEASFARAQALFEAAGARANLASVMHNRAWIAKGRGDPATALVWYERALEIKRAVQGPDHPQTLTSMLGRGQVLAQLGRHADAAALFAELLERSRRVHGPETKPVETALNELASVSQDLGDYAAAQRYYTESLALARKLSGGAASMSIAVGANNLASLLEERGDAGGADQLYRESIAMRTDVLPERHPSIGTPMHNLARLLLGQERAAEALPLAEEALALRTAGLGPEHPLTLGAMLLLAQVAAAAGDAAHADALLRDAEARMQTSRLDSASVRTQLHLTQAGIAQARGDAGAHATAMQAAVAESARRLAPGHPKVAQLRLALAESRLAAGQPDQARAIVEEVAPTLRRALVPGAAAMERLQRLERATPSAR